MVKINPRNRRRYKGISATRRVERFINEQYALVLEIEQRKEQLDSRIQGKSQPARAELWREFLAANERDLSRLIQLDRLIGGLTL